MLIYKRLLFLVFLLLVNIHCWQSQTILNISTSVPTGDYIARDKVVGLPGSKFIATPSAISHLYLDKNIIAPIDADGNPYSGYSISSEYVIDKNLPVGVVNGDYSINNGQAFYNIPIPVAPGTAGFIPNLGISYNSASTEGLLGVGWNISGISIISRSPRDVFHNYASPPSIKSSSPINLDNFDAVYLDGNYLKNTIIGYSPSAPAYKLDNDNFSEVTRIFSGGIAISYSVLTKDGLKMEYGNTPDSRLMVKNELGVDVPLNYYINKVTDKLGNYYTYEYYNLNGEVAIKEVKYTGNTAAAITPYNSIKFYYDERQDKNIKFIKGNKLKSSLILREIELFCEGVSFKKIVPKYDFIDARTHLTSITEYGADNSHLNPTKFSYDFSNGSGSITNSIISSTELPTNADYNVADFDGDGLSDVMAYLYSSIDPGNGLRVYTGWQLYKNLNDGTTYTKITEDLTGGFIPYSFFGALGGGLQAQGKTIGNLNGDDKADMLLLKNSGINTIYTPFYSTGTSFVAGTSFTLPFGAQLILADINGDKIPEAISNGNYGSSTGSMRVHSFVTNTTLFSSFLFNNYKIMSVIDYDGDGSQELLIERTGKVEVLKIKISNTTSTTMSISVIDQDYLMSGYGHNKYYGDFNGDGLTDQVYQGEISPNFFLRYGTQKNNGAFPSSFLHSPSTSLAHIVPTIRDTTEQILITDMNNDGKSDIVKLVRQINPSEFSTSIDMYITYGHDITNKVYVGSFVNNFPYVIDRGYYTQFVGPYAMRPYPAVSNTYEPEFNIGDFDGDGYTDIIYRSSNGKRAIIYNTFKSPYNHIYTRNKLTRVTNGFNRTVKFNYGSLAKGTNYTKGSGSSYPFVDTKNPYSIVTSVLNQDANSNFYSTNYTYSGAKLNMHGKGFLGFDKITIHNDLSQTITSTEYSLNTTYAERLPITSKVFLYSNTVNPISETQYSYNYIETPSSGINLKQHYSQLSNSTQFDNIKGIITTNEYTYDPFNNILTAKTNVNGGLLIETITNTIDANLYGNKYPTKIQSREHVAQRLGKPIITKNNRFFYNSNGLLNYQINNEGKACESQITYNYNSNTGVPLTITATSAGNTPRASSFVYDSKHRFVTSSVNPMGYVQQSIYDNRWGQPIKTIDITNLETIYTYDGYGRNNKITTPDNNSVVSLITWYDSGIDDIMGDPFPASNILITSQRMAPNTPMQKDFFTASGLHLKSITQGFNSNYASNLKTYNNKGQVVISKNNYLIPCVNPALVLTSSANYDNLNRLLNSVVTDGTTNLNTSFAYSQIGGNYKTVITSPDGKIKESITDATDLTLQVKDNNGNTLNYDYYSNGQLQETKLLGNIVNSFTYDDCGNIETQDEPNYGFTNYHYDGFGQLVDRTNDGKTFNYSYDVLGRPMTINVPEGNYNYTYIASGAGLGNINTITAPSGAETKMYYDALNRAYKKDETISGNLFTHLTEFDLFNNPIKFTYPSGLKLTMEYNTIGYPKKIKNSTSGQLLWEANEMGDYGNYTKYTLGNGIQTNNTYNTFGVLQNTSAGTVFDHTYNFNLQNGNLNYLKDNLKNLTENFLYDNLDRLTQSQVTDNFTSVSLAPLNLTYDAQGNIKSKTDIGNYKYHTTKTNAVIAVQNSSSLISSVTQDVNYTSFEKVETIIEGDEQAIFNYGANQERVKADYINTVLGTTKTRYYVGNYEKETDGTNTRETHYVTAPSGLVGMYVIETGLPDKMYYAYTDHLGTPKTITNESGAIVFEQNYDPWGQSRNANTWNYTSIATPPNWLYRGFTGHEHLPQFSLINMNGRLYDPQNARMLNVDPVLQDPTNSQNHNKYTYALNNPLKYTDPTGNEVDLNLNPQLFLTPLSGQLSPEQEDLYHYNQYKAMGGSLSGLSAGYENYAAAHTDRRNAIRSGDLTLTRLTHWKTWVTTTQSASAVNEVNIVIDQGTDEYYGRIGYASAMAIAGGDDPIKPKAQGGGGGVLSSPRGFANELKYYYKFNSGTDYHLTQERFNDVFNQAHQNNAIQWNKVTRLANGNYSIPVNFYKTDYDFAFGRATMNFSFDKTNGFKPVGFYDIWDLDPKAWGTRSYFNEGVTRYFNWQLNGGKPFKVTYP